MGYILPDVFETFRMWGTVVDPDGRAGLDSVIPDGWSIATDRWYCGSSSCRVVEFHHDHGSGPHWGCFATLYGTYTALVAEVKSGRLPEVRHD